MTATETYMLQRINAGEFDQPVLVRPREPEGLGKRVDDVKEPYAEFAAKIEYDKARKDYREKLDEQSKNEPSRMKHFWAECARAFKADEKFFDGKFFEAMMLTAEALTKEDEHGGKTNRDRFFSLRELMFLYRTHAREMAARPPVSRKGVPGGMSVHAFNETKGHGEWLVDHGVSTKERLAGEEIINLANEVDHLSLLLKTSEERVSLLVDQVERLMGENKKLREASNA